MASIVILGSAHPLRGGLANYNERLARQCTAEGHDVIMYTFSLQYPAVLFPGKSQYSDQPKPTDIEIRVRVNSINPINWFLVGKEIARLKPDLLIVKFWLPFMGPCFGTILRQVKKNRHTTVISIIDNIIPHEKRPGDRALANYFCGGVDAFITMSDSVLKDLDQFDQNKPRLMTLHPIYDNFGAPVQKTEARKSLNLPEDGKILLFFGFIRDYKGLDLLLKALADPRLKELGVKVMIAGEFYCDAEPYEKLIQELDLEERIFRFMDFIPDNKVRQYFGASDLVVQPYKHATQSGVTQICYNFNKPMLVTDVGGLAEIVPNGKVGYVTQPEPSSIANAIFDFYSNGREEDFTAGVIEEKKRFGWDVLTEKIFSLESRLRASS
jgi:glycosyltransferase involved in cell wall biosynthesis